MPQRIGIQNVIEFKWFCSQGTQLSVNRVRFYCESIVGAGGLLSEAVLDMDNQGGANLPALLTNQATYRGCTAQIISPFVSLSEISDANQSNGDVAGDPLPPQISGLVSFRTDFAGRANRGRMYVPFPSTTNSATNGKPTVGYLTNLGAWADAVLLQRTFGAAGNTSFCWPIIYHSSGITPVGPRLRYRLNRTAWSQQRRRSYLRRPDIFPF